MITLTQLPAFEDNYVYVVDAGHDSGVVVVDPGDAAVVTAFLASARRGLAAIVLTHHHADHVGGVAALVEQTGCRVFGASHDRARLPCVTDAVDVGASIDIAGLTLRTLDVRAHTLGHIAYALDVDVDRVVVCAHGAAPVDDVDRAGRPALFVGDALFGAGCGRLFEGTPDDLVAALRTLAACAPRALICCAHEYTRTNLRFAREAFPDVDAIRVRLDDVVARGAPTVPSTLALELTTNPFLLALVADGDVVSRVAALRAARNAFR